MWLDTKIFLHSFPPWILPPEMKCTPGSRVRVQGGVTQLVVVCAQWGRVTLEPDILR